MSSDHKDWRGRFFRVEKISGPTGIDKGLLTCYKYKISKYTRSSEVWIVKNAQKRALGFGAYDKNSGKAPRVSRAGLSQKGRLYNG